MIFFRNAIVLLHQSNFINNDSRSQITMNALILKNRMTPIWNVFQIQFSKRKFMWRKYFVGRLRQSGVSNSAILRILSQTLINILQRLLNN